MWFGMLLETDFMRVARPATDRLDAFQPASLD